MNETTGVRPDWLACRISCCSSFEMDVPFVVASTFFPSL
jgi:hypothetical protein